MRLLVREALLSFRRAPLLSALSVTTIAFSLFVFGLFGLVGAQPPARAPHVAERVEVVAYLNRGTPTEAITAGDARTSPAFPEVAERQLRDRGRGAGPGPRELSSSRTSSRTSRSTRCRPRSRSSSSPSCRDASQRPGRGRPARAASASWTTCATAGTGSRSSTACATSPAWSAWRSALAFALVAIVIIGITIRMAVLQRKREIAIMRLVGATDGFIRGPFLLEGVIKGAAGRHPGGGAVLRLLSPLPQPGQPGHLGADLLRHPAGLARHAVRRPASGWAAAW